MTLNDFVSKYEGKSKGYPTDTQYLGECLSLAKLYIKDRFGINPPPSGTNSAYGYWSNFPSPLGTVFEKITNTDTSYPLVGDIIIWKPWTTNKYGHIAICLSGNVNSFVSLDQNWGTKNAKRITHDYENVVGYLRGIIKPVTNSDNMTTEETNILKFLKENNANEGKVREAFGALGVVIEKDKQIQTLQSRVLDLEKSLKDLTDRMTALESNIQADLNLITDWQQKCQTANKQLENANKSNQELIVEKNKYKGYYEAKLDEIKKLDKMTAWQHIRYGISLLTIKK